MTTNQRNPYAPPQADVETIDRPVAAAPALWNPNAAASWSLLFSPIFGAILHMKNWQALGETQKAATSKAWAIGSAICIAVLALSPVFVSDSKAMDALGRFSGLALLISWYYAVGKSQQTYVMAKFGKTYPRRGWSKPLLAAIGVLLGFFALLFIAGLLIAGVSSR